MHLKQFSKPMFASLKPTIGLERRRLDPEINTTDGQFSPAGTGAWRTPAFGRASLGGTREGRRYCPPASLRGLTARGLAATSRATAAD
jgi:hypothetical protein